MYIPAKVVSDVLSVLVETESPVILELLEIVISPVDVLLSVTTQYLSLVWEFYFWCVVIG